MCDNAFNKLEIIGTDDQVKQVREFLKGKPYEDGSECYIDFNNIVKMPEEVINTIKSSSFCDQIDWYDWSCDNWGTKWNAYTQMEISDNTLGFETAWCGVPGLVQKLSLKFLDVTFSYNWDDHYDDYHYTIIGGEIINKSCSDVLYETIGHPEFGLKTSLQISEECKSIFDTKIDPLFFKDISDFDIGAALKLEQESWESTLKGNLNQIDPLK